MCVNRTEQNGQVKATAATTADAVYIPIEHYILVVGFVLLGVLCILWNPIPGNSREEDEEPVLVHDGE